MSKAVLISIRPEWCEKIMTGQKTIEVRKTRPKMDPPFLIALQRVTSISRRTKLAYCDYIGKEYEEWND